LGGCVGLFSGGGGCGHFLTGAGRRGDGSLRRDLTGSLRLDA